MTYKCVHSLTADHLADCIRLPMSAASYLHMGLDSSAWSPVCTSFRDRYRGQVLAVAGPRLWNSLPTFVISIGSLAVFKKQLKTIAGSPAGLSLASIRISNRTVGRCGVVGSTLAFGSIGHGFESEHRLFSHQGASASSKLRFLAKCSLDDSVRRLL